MDVTLIGNAGSGATSAPEQPAASEQKDRSEKVPEKKAAPAVDAPVTQRTVSKTEFNTDAQRVVFQLIHPLSDSVVAQFPNESLLKLREYVSDHDGRSASPSLAVRA